MLRIFVGLALLASAVRAEDVPLWNDCPGKLLAALEPYEWPLTGAERRVLKGLDSEGVAPFGFAWKVAGLIEGRGFVQGIEDPKDLVGRLVVGEDPDKDPQYPGLRIIAGKVISIHQEPGGLFWFTLERSITREDTPITRFAVVDLRLVHSRQGPQLTLYDPDAEEF